MIKKYVFDTETYRNFFCAVFKDMDTKEIKEFAIHNNVWTKGTIKELKETVHKNVLIGYNNKYYDNVILERILMDIPLSKVKKVSDDIIVNNNRIYVNKEDWFTVDLMSLIFNDRGDSLKLMGCKIRHNKLQELPIDPDKEITQEEAEILLKYCNNDVIVTEKLANSVEQRLILRKAQSVKYNLYLMSESDSGIHNKVLKKQYKALTDLEYSDFKNQRTERETIEFKDVIFDNICFESEQLQEFHSQMINYTWRKRKVPQKEKLSDRKNKHWSEIDYSFEPSLAIGDLHLQLGIGGIHSEDEPDIFFQKTIDCDVASFYPFAIASKRRSVNGEKMNGIVAKHLDNRIVQVYKNKIFERIEAKKRGDKVTSGDLKIYLNSHFGKYGSPLHFLYDPLALLRVTVNNQLYLLMLIEDLILAGFQVISTNTDGIICIQPDSEERMEEYYSICSAWEEQTKSDDLIRFNLEYTYYDFYVREHVNSYMTITNEGSKKYKGSFLYKQDLMKGYNTSVVGKCLEWYFLQVKEGVEDPDLEHHIRNANYSIHDFCYAQKVGKQFDVYYGDDQVGQINRYYVSTQGKKLTKVKWISEKNTYQINEVIAGKTVIIANDIIDESDLSLIDFDYYINATYKIVDKIMKRYFINIVYKNRKVRGFIKRSSKDILTVTQEVMSWAEKSQKIESVVIHEEDKMQRFDKKIANND